MFKFFLISIKEILHYRAKDLRVRLYELSEKSRTYKQFNPFSLKPLSYEFDNFPKYVLPNYNKKVSFKIYSTCKGNNFCKVTTLSKN